MCNRGASAFALGAALLIVSAGMVMMAAMDDTDVSDFDPPAVADAGQTTLGDVSAPGSLLHDQYEEYRELFTYAPSTSNSRFSSSEDRKPEAGPHDGDRLHRWVCPVCDETKLSFSSARVDPKAEAVNNLRTHIRASEGNGHGPRQTLPSELTGDSLLSHVTLIDLSD